MKQALRKSKLDLRRQRMQLEQSQPVVDSIIQTDGNLEISQKRVQEQHTKGRLLDSISPDDPNFKAKTAFLQAWADSHGVVADAFGGKISLRDYVESCAFDQGAKIHVSFKDDSSIQERCGHIDVLAAESIRLFNRSLQKESKRLGKEKHLGSKKTFF